MTELRWADGVSLGLVVAALSLLLLLVAELSERVRVHSSGAGWIGTHASLGWPRGHMNSMRDPLRVQVATSQARALQSWALSEYPDVGSMRQTEFNHRRAGSTLDSGSASCTPTPRVPQRAQLLPPTNVFRVESLLGASHPAG
jgi:hypothetical protein